MRVHIIYPVFDINLCKGHLKTYLFGLHTGVSAAVLGLLSFASAEVTVHSKLYMKQYAVSNTKHCICIHGH